MTPNEIAAKAEQVAVECLTEIREYRAGGECSDREMRQIIETRVEAALREVTGVN